MTPNGEGIWLGNGRHITYLHQDAHFNFFAMVTGIKRVLLYPLEAIPDLYPTPFYGGIAGTTSSYVRPGAPDLQKFPRFADAARHSWVAQIEDGDVLCLPPCWWHHVEAAPGVNLMINTFAWALPPKQEYDFEVLMRKSVRIALGLSREELASVRTHLYQGSNGSAPSTASLSRSARMLSQGLARFLRPDIPAYWQSIAKTYYDHYIFQLNGHPVSAYPERHTVWARQEGALKQRLRQWFRFTRGVSQMTWRRRRTTGIVP
jgi:Cupin-like domain